MAADKNPTKDMSALLARDRENSRKRQQQYPDNLQKRRHFSADAKQAFYYDGRPCILDADICEISSPDVQKRKSTHQGQLKQIPDVETKNCEASVCIS